MGRVRSLERLVTNSKGVTKRIKGRILKPINRNGYYVVNLHANARCKMLLVHRLVAETFIPNLYTKEQVNHKNGIKLDNRLENLEWTTPKENTHHAIRTGLSHPKESTIRVWREKRKYMIDCLQRRSTFRPKGELNPNAKLTREDVSDIRQKFSQGYSIHDLQNMYTIARQTVENILNNKRWHDAAYTPPRIKGHKIEKIRNGCVVKTYKTLAEIDAELSRLNAHSAISACCRGKRKSYLGFQWHYAKD